MSLILAVIDIRYNKALSHTFIRKLKLILPFSTHSGKLREARKTSPVCHMLVILI